MLSPSILLSPTCSVVPAAGLDFCFKWNGVVLMTRLQAVLTAGDPNI